MRAYRHQLEQGYQRMAQAFYGAVHAVFAAVSGALQGEMALN